MGKGYFTSYFITYVVPFFILNVYLFILRESVIEYSWKHTSLQLNQEKSKRIYLAPSWLTLWMSWYAVFTSSSCRATQLPTSEPAAQVMQNSSLQPSLMFQDRKGCGWEVRRKARILWNALWWTQLAANAIVLCFLNFLPMVKLTQSLKVYIFPPTMLPGKCRFPHLSLKQK